MAGTCGYFDKVVNNIKEISKRTYVTIGTVLTEDNVQETENIICFAHDLGVSDIRIIPSAQYNKINQINISDEILSKHPILKYRINNIKNNVSIRGLSIEDSNHCWLLCDDTAIMGDYFFPCIIALREGCPPIGKVGPNMKQERMEWIKKHDCIKDPICGYNCLDVCACHNRRIEEYLNQSIIPF
jgi:MoaA/NifB/PqqE/SkfB family radical SAM enzyme